MSPTVPGDGEKLHALPEATQAVPWDSQPSFTHSHPQTALGAPREAEDRGSRTAVLVGGLGLGEALECG